MTEFKRRTLYLSTGKQIKLYGNSMAIGRSLEIGEGSAPNILCFIEQQLEEKLVPEPADDQQNGTTEKSKQTRRMKAAVLNPHRLTKEELQEVADFNIRLWMDLKDKIREYGVNDPKIFNREA